MKLPTIVERTLKFLEPERNNNKQRISVLEHRVEEIEIYLQHIKIFPASALHEPNPSNTNVAMSGRLCGHCNENLYSAKACGYIDCPMGLHITPEL